MKKQILYSAGFVMLAILFAGCSTEKNTRASRIFHNINSKYNVYFNGNESLKKGISTIDERIEDDFTRLLPVYKESSPSAAKMVTSDMENAILKGSKLIEIHSITKKPKPARKRTRKYIEFASKEEFNKYIDDAYLMMGKAYFYQHNFISAIDNFSYVTRKFPNDDTRYEADVWLVRCYTELERYNDAAAKIESIQGDNGFPRKLERELAVATADFYIRQKEYTEAIKLLDIAIKKTFWKKNRARLQYIKAQLYNETGQSNLAIEAFDAVKRMGPDYKMAFNARINAAGLFSGTGDPESIKKELRKMLKDNKNKDFRDQIYFALGNILLKEGNRKEATECYRKSVANSFQNQFQRAQSSITLADIYFSELNYKGAQAYYDSAMIIIDETYPDFSNLSSRYKSLSTLVDYLVTVEREDSLQKIAKMPDTEREALIARIMKEEQDKQRNQENLATQNAMNMGYYRANEFRMGMGGNTSGGGWYFYNPQTISYGKVTFQQRWGKRKLEDNWRRSNKNLVVSGSQEGVAIDSSKLVKRERDPLKKEFYTQDLPLNDSLMKVSHEKIRDALYNAGKIFKTEFKNYNRSVESLKSLNSRYPDNIYELSAFFDLYDDFEILGDKEKSDNYKKLIISKYPESKYAQYLQNPNFFVELEAKTEKFNTLYEDVFKMYKTGKYSEILQHIPELKELRPDSLILPKIEFMETVARGTQADVSQFEALLRKYVEKYPKASPTPLANEIIALIKDSALVDYQKLIDLGYIRKEIENKEVTTTQKNGNDEFGGKFSYEEDLLHYFVIVYPRDKKIDLNRLKFDIANYNIDHYTKLDFDIETENLDDKSTLLLVRAIDNKENALIYHRAIIRDPSVFMALKDVKYTNFVISSSNYRQITAEKSITDYLRFFVKNYSRFTGADFDASEFDSPEDLMARMRKENNALKEQGKYVVVNTGAQPVKGEFREKNDTAQCFVLAVKDLNLPLRQVITGFSDFNRNEFKGFNLVVKQDKITDYQLVIISGIPSLNESMSYFRKVVTTRSLFEPLGQTTYRNFLITDDNLKKLLKDGKVDNYLEFFRNNYIQRGKSTSTPPTTPAPANSQPPTENNAKTPKTDAAAVQPKPEYTGPYQSNVANAPHRFVFVLQHDGYDKPKFVEGISAFNNANSFSALKIEEIPLDNIRLIISVSGIKDKEQGLAYLSLITKDRTLFAPLGNTTYRNFLISEQNLGIFLKEKNITDYVNFFKQFYLGQ